MINKKGYDDDSESWCAGEYVCMCGIGTKRICICMLYGFCECSWVKVNLHFSASSAALRPAKFIHWQGRRLRSLLD